MIPDFFSFQARTRIVFGAGQIGDLGFNLERLGASKFLLVTDKVLADLGFVDKAKAGVEDSEVEIAAVYDGVLPNSEVAQVTAAAELAKQHGCDGVLGLGGGSAMDTAKAVAILLTFGGDLLDYEGAQMLTGRLVPHAAIPTTSGTGSEVTNVSVVLSEAEDRKVSFLDDWIFPDLAVLDPELAAGLPPRVTAATGMDALTHAIEAYVDVQHSPFSDALALQATGLIHRYLARAVKQGAEDPEARAGMMVAASLAGLAFTHSMVGVVHGISHALGGVYHCAHGEANAVMLPACMRFNLEAEPARFARLGHELGVDPSLPEAKAAEACVEAVEALRQEVAEASGMPATLKDLQVPEDGFSSVADKAMEEGSMLYNPRPVEDSDVLALLREAF
jgi:alcohol dehydrogenase class IV